MSIIWQVLPFCCFFHIGLISSTHFKVNAVANAVLSQFLKTFLQTIFVSFAIESPHLRIFKTMQKCLFVMKDCLYIIR